MDEAPGLRAAGRRVGVEGDVARELLGDQAGDSNRRDVGVAAAGEWEQGQGGAGLRLGGRADQQSAAGVWAGGRGAGRTRLDRDEGIRIQFADQSPQVAQIDRVRAWERGRLARIRVPRGDDRDSVEVSVQFLRVESAEQLRIARQRRRDHGGIRLRARNGDRRPLQRQRVLLHL